MADPTKLKMRAPLRWGGALGFIGGFLLAYQRSSGKCSPSTKTLFTYPFFQLSAILGLVREQERGGVGPTGAH